MKSAVEQLDDVLRIVSIELEPKEVDARFNLTYHEFAYRYLHQHDDAQGFDTNKIDSIFGAEAVAKAVTDSLRQEAFSQAAVQHNLVPLGSARYSEESIAERGKAFAFKARVACSPLFDLTSYDPVVIKLPVALLQELKGQAHEEETYRRIKETEVLHALQQRLQGEAPEVLCDAEEQNVLQAMYAQANQANIPFEAFLAQRGISLEQFKHDVVQQALSRVRSNLALDAWAQHFDIKAADADVLAEFERNGSPYPAYEFAEWTASGRITTLRQAITRGLALQRALDSALVEEI